MKPGNRRFANAIEMVPIHTKHMLWKMRERKIEPYYAFLLILQKGVFIILAVLKLNVEF
jgi:hypothetical protein